MEKNPFSVILHKWESILIIYSFANFEYLTFFMYWFQHVEPILIEIHNQILKQTEVVISLRGQDFMLVRNTEHLILIFFRNIRDFQTHFLGNSRNLQRLIPECYIIGIFNDQENSRFRWYPQKSSFRVNKNWFELERLFLNSFKIFVILLGIFASKLWKIISDLYIDFVLHDWMQELENIIFSNLINVNTPYRLRYHFFASYFLFSVLDPLRDHMGSWLWLYNQTVNSVMRCYDLLYALDHSVSFKSK